VYIVCVICVCWYVFALFPRNVYAIVTCQIKPTYLQVWLISYTCELSCCCGLVSRTNLPTFLHSRASAFVTQSLRCLSLVSMKFSSNTNSSQPTTSEFCHQEKASFSHHCITLISYSGCLALSPVISVKIHSNGASQPKIRKNSLKTPILGVQGHSRLSMLVPPESSSAVFVMIRSKSVSICNRSRARLVESSRNRAFGRGYPNLMHLFGGLLEPRENSGKIGNFRENVFLHAQNLANWFSWKSLKLLPPDVR